MSGVEDTDVIDLVTHDSSKDEFVLIMIETRPWDDSPVKLAQLREKIRNYVSFAREGGLTGMYPAATSKPVRLQLACTTSPTGEALEIVKLTAEQLMRHDIRFVINVME
jgi:hypothetical protein